MSKLTINRWQTKSNYRIIQLLSGRSNVFLFSNGEKNILIDTSVERQKNKLVENLNKLNISNLDYLILTHTHFDHAASASFIKHKFLSMVIVHQSEAENLISGENLMISGTNMLTKAMASLAVKRIKKIFRFQACNYDILVNSDLTDLGFNAFILHTPGHTNGSLSIIVDNEIAIVGDTMFGVFPNSIFPPYAQDIKEMVKSWGKLLETGCKLFLPSHGSAIIQNLVAKEYDKWNKKLV